VSHGVGRAAETAFEALVPDEWVARRQTEDYGIDDEIEVFDEEEATGDLFKVQLKGREFGRSTRASVRVRTSTFLYWQNLAVPVLRVLLDTASSRAFGRWVHAIDELKDVEELPRNFLVPFDQNHRLDRPTFVNLHRDAVVFRAIRTRAVLGPLPIRLEIYDTWDGASPAAIKAHITRLLGPRRVAEVAPDDFGDPCATIALSAYTTEDRADAALVASEKCMS